MDDLQRLAQEEDAIAALVGSVAGDMSARAVQLAELGVFARYQSVFDRYVELVDEPSTRLEAFKRAQFLAWYDLSEPACFSGLRLDRDGQHLQRVSEAAEATLADGKLDDELAWMLPYYHDLTGGGFPGLASQPKLADFLRRADPLSFLAVRFAPDQFRGRGGMGAYWRSAFDSRDRHETQIVATAQQRLLRTYERPRQVKRDEMPRRAKSLIASACLGGVAGGATIGLGSLGAGCCAIVLLPIAGFVIGRFLPGGVPGASVAVAVLLAAVFPYDAGPTAMSTTLGAAIFGVASMLAAEWLGAASHRRKSSESGPDAGSVTDSSLR